MNNNRTKALVEGAIFASLTAVFGILAHAVPVFFIFAMLWPTPIIVLGYRNGFKTSFLSSVVAFAIVAMFLGPVEGFASFAMYGLPGITMGYLLFKKVKPGTAVFVTSMVFFVSIVINLMVGFWLSGVGTNFIAAYNSTFDMALERAQESIQIYKGLGLSEEALNQNFNQVKEMIEILKVVFPITIVFSAIFISFTNFKTTKMILKRMKCEIEDVPKFSEWRIGPVLSFVLLASIAILYLVYYFKIPYWEILIPNIMQLIMMIFSVIGLSVVVYYINLLSERFKVSKFTRILCIIMAFLYMGRVTFFIGAIDAVLNLRKYGNNIARKTGGA